MRSSSTPTSMLIAPVIPAPREDHRVVVLVPPTASRMIARASSRKRVVWSPVPDDSVWVLAYSGRTGSRI